jgi:membrane AbrB-like protein
LVFRLPDRLVLRRVAETLAVAACGGATLGIPGFPAGWLSGAIVAVAVAALAGRPVTIPERLAQVTFVITGISLGGAVSPESVANMGTWPLSMLALAVAMVGLTASVAFYLHKVHRWDTTSAVLGASPGGLATVLVLANEYGADVRSVAIVQTVRIVVLAVILPGTLTALGLAGSPSITRTAASFLAQPGQLFALIVICTAIAVAAQWVRFPGGLIFGAMTSSAVLHGSGLIHVGLPPWLAIISFVVLGALTGTRFANTDAQLLKRLAGAAIGACAVGMLVALAFAVATATLLSLNTGDLIIAYAPGALEAMMILALALHFDPAFVGAHHLFRFMLVLVSIPIVIPWIARKPQPPKQPGKAE